MATTAAARIAAAPHGGNIGWIPPVRWQANQRRAVRGARAWYRPNRRLAGVIEFRRIDSVEYIWEGLDGWGHAHIVGSISRSFWVCPAGREFPTLQQAIAAYC